MINILILLIAIVALAGLMIEIRAHQHTRQQVDQLHALLAARHDEIETLRRTIRLHKNAARAARINAPVPLGSLHTAN
jgi:hypothetical protein